MELRTIETFLAVTTYGSFSRAAERLGYSQSAVTMQIKQLEAELGARLFDRVPRGARLTDEGRAFSFHAHQIAADVARARRAVRGDAEPADLTGTLRIGSVESISTALMPELLVRFTRAHPHAELVVQTTRIDRLVELTRAGEIDLVLTMERPLAIPGFIREVLREEEIVLVAQPGLIARARKEQPGTTGSIPASLSPAELATLPFVLTERGESYRLELDRALAAYDIALTPVVETGNTETLVHLAERGVGVAFLPRFSVEGALAAGTLELVQSELAPVRMASQLFYHQKKWVSPLMAAFLATVREGFAAPKMGQLGTCSN